MADYSSAFPTVAFEPHGHTPTSPWVITSFVSSFQSFPLRTDGDPSESRWKHDATRNVRFGR